MARVVHFEIHAENPERAVAFYTSVFGWNIQKWGSPDAEYWVVMTGNETSQMKGREGQGIDGGILRRKGPAPQEGQAVNAYVCTVEIENVDEYTAKVEKAGGTIALPKMAVPGVGWLAYYKDTEGNIFGMMHNDSGAK